MGQKTHPIGFRLGISKDWKWRYYANRDLPGAAEEDELLRKYLKARLGHAAIADITIERKPGKVVVTMHTGRPGVVIGKKGAEVDKLRDELAQLTGKEVGINVEEIKRPELDAQLVADNIAEPARAAHLVPSRHEARGAERDAHGRAGHQDQVRRPAGRRGNRARRGLSRGTCAAAHAARRHRLRDVDGEDHFRHHRREGLDLQGREGRRPPWYDVLVRHVRRRDDHAESEARQVPQEVQGPHEWDAARGSEIAFGTYGLQALEPGWITARQIEAARVALTRHIKRGGKVWIRIFPDKPITKKPAETRMGKGKGSPEGWVAVVKPGRVMFELEGVTREIAEKAMALAAAKMPVQYEVRGARGGAHHAS